MHFRQQITEDFQVLQLVVHAMFGVLDWLLSYSMDVDSTLSKLKMKIVTVASVTRSYCLILSVHHLLSALPLLERSFDTKSGRREFKWFTVYYGPVGS